MVLHFITDAEDPWEIVATLRDALAPGSYLVLCHATNESKPTVAQAAEKVYNRSVATQVHIRSRAEILRFFDGFELVDPGLVYIPQWRPDSPSDVPRIRASSGAWSASARSPDHLARAPAERLSTPRGPGPPAGERREMAVLQRRAHCRRSTASLSGDD